MGLFGDLLEQFDNIKNLTNVFGGSNGSKTYPDKVGKNLAALSITNQPKYSASQWKGLPRGYSFHVIQVMKSPSGEETINDKVSGFKEFRLQINPQELSQDEIFAIEVTPTLRGVIVEHHGTVLKDITISGTTGISPLRREGGANKKTGDPILQKGTSGYQEFHELRSYFRMYVEAKRLDQRQNGELRMIFKNYKDEEYLYVEPQKFSMKRSASKPHLYDYSIALKAIGVANGALPNQQGAAGFLGQVDDLLSTVTDSIQLATQVIQGSIGIITRSERNIQSAILNPIQQINTALLQISGGLATTFGPFGITRRFIDATKASIETFEANLNDVFGFKTAGYNAITGRTQTVVAAAGRKATFSEVQVLNAMGKLKTAMITLAAQNQLFEQNVFDLNASVVDQYGGSVVMQTPNSVDPVRIQNGDTLQSLAVRHLGNADLYRDIAILNNLKPPFIAAVAGPGVLGYNDVILIPSQDTVVDTGIKQNKQYNITANLPAAKKAMGVDMRLTKDGDIAIANTGDADLIAGMDNMSQAIVTKLLIEVGSLKRHPTVGTSLSIGQKVTSEVVNNLHDQVVTSLSSDPRIVSIPFAGVAQNAGTTTLNLVINLRNIAQPVPLPLTIKTG